MLALAALGSCGCCWRKTELTVDCKPDWPSEQAKRSVNPLSEDGRIIPSNTTTIPTGSLSLACEQLEKNSDSQKICLTAREVSGFIEDVLWRTDNHQRVINASRVKKRDAAASQCCQWTKACAEHMAKLEEGGDPKRESEDWAKVLCCIDTYLFSCPNPPNKEPLCYGPPPTCYNDWCPEGGVGSVEG